MWHSLSSLKIGLIIILRYILFKKIFSWNDLKAQTFVISQLQFLWNLGAAYLDSVAQGFSWGCIWGCNLKTWLGQGDPLPRRATSITGYWHWLLAGCSVLIHVPSHPLGPFFFMWPFQQDSLDFCTHWLGSSWGRKWESKREREPASERECS